MVKFFKVIALLEGLSLLALLFIAMPMKYMFGDPFLVKHVGMAHGVLFVGYVMMAIIMKFELSWSWKKFGLVCLASIVPFGTFYMEKKYFPKASSL